LMYKVSKQGKHLMMSITASKLRWLCIKAKIFTVGITVIELTRRDPYNKHRIRTKGK
jgi:hypothetical protein